MKDSPITDTAAVQGLDHLFDAALQFRSDSLNDAVVPPDGREGVYIGSGDGTVTGPVFQGTMQWSLYSGNCLYPLIRQGQTVSDDLHICTLNPGGVITTDDGVRIRFDGKGYGLRTPEKYLLSMTIVFGTEETRFDWLTKVLGVMEGKFDEHAGRGTWRVCLPRPEAQRRPLLNAAPGERN